MTTHTSLATRILALRDSAIEGNPDAVRSAIDNLRVSSAEIIEAIATPEDVHRIAEAAYRCAHGLGYATPSVLPDIDVLRTILADTAVAIFFTKGDRGKRAAAHLGLEAFVNSLPPTADPTTDHPAGPA